MLLKATMPVDTGNAAISNGTLGPTIEKIIAQIKPECAYFVEENGERTAYMVFDMTDSSQLPAVAEPFFLAFNAKVTVRPAMNAQDLAKAAPGMAQAVKAFGAGA
jgi:hypothetical protein